MPTKSHSLEWSAAGDGKQLSQVDGQGRARRVDVGDIDLPERGSLGGLLTALCHAEDADWLLLLSCDLTEFRSEWLRPLEAARTPEARIVAFETDPWQPFPALYHCALVPLVRDAIDREQLSMQRLLQTAKTVSVPLPPDWPDVPQANTREELERYRTKE